MPTGKKTVTASQHQQQVQLNKTILRFIFIDDLLKEFSYEEQKKKKVFSVLAIYSIFHKKGDNIFF